MAKRRAGLEPLSYMGVNPSSPPQMIHRPFAPVANNNENVDIGTFWIVTDTDEIYVLTGLTATTARWVLISGSDVLGDAPIDVNIVGGVATVSLINGADGQVLIGGGAGAAWANITSTGGTVAIADTANGINLEATGVAGLTGLDGDTGSATPVAGVIIVAGGTNITTAGAGQTITVTVDDPLAVADLEVTNVLTLSGLTTGALVSDASGAISSINGTDGQLMIAGTGLDPIWANLTSTNGSVVIAEGPNSINLSSTNAGFSSPYIVNSRSINAYSGETITGASFQQGTGIWVACGYDPGVSTSSSIYTSYDGVTWTRSFATVSHPTLDAFKDVHCGSSGWCVAAGSMVGPRTFFTAENPTLPWTRRTVGILYQDFTMVNFDGTYWLLWGISATSSQTTVLYSTDVTGSWTAGAAYGVGRVLSGSAYGGGVWVVVGRDSYISSTSDPTGAWTQRTNPFVPTVNINSVAYSAALGIFCLVADSGQVATSTDGTTWTERVNPVNFVTNIVSVLWNPYGGLFIASTSSSGLTIMSYDGVNWFRAEKAISGSVSLASAVEDSTGEFAFFNSSGGYFTNI